MKKLKSKFTKLLILFPILFFAFILFRSPIANAMSPPYCPQQIYIKNTSYSHVVKILNFFTPFNKWDVDFSPEIEENTCISTYVRPNFYYSYRSPQTGIVYTINFVMTIPANPLFIGIPGPGEMSETILMAQLADEAIRHTEANNDLSRYGNSRQLYGYIVLTNWPEINYSHEEDLSWREYDDNPLISFDYETWDQIPNSDHTQRLKNVRTKVLPVVLILKLLPVILITISLFTIVLLIKNLRKRRN